MSSEVEINRNSVIQSSTLPEVVLASEEYEFGLNLISTMAATRENIVRTIGTTVIPCGNSSSLAVGNKVVDSRDVSRGSRSSSVANSPGSVTEEPVGGRLNDSEGVSLILDEQNTENNDSNVPINASTIVVEESFAIDDTDTDDDVILVVQPIETIELLGDDDDADVQIVNSDEPIPKPKRLPQPQQQQQQQPHQSTSTSSSSSNNNNITNTFPTPRLPEPTSGLAMYSDDEHLAPILKDLLDDHFGQLDFDLPLTLNMQMTPETEITTTHNNNNNNSSDNNYGKSHRGLFVSHLTTEMAIQTEEEYKPEMKDMETQTNFSVFHGKRKLRYLENDVDGDECPICYVPWEESGDHSLVSLKCGHLFGDSCLKKWLIDQHGHQKQRLCPVCRAKVEMKDIRKLYARRIIQVNADPEVKRLKEELEVTKECAKKFEAMYKREIEKGQRISSSYENVMQGQHQHQRRPSTSNANIPPLISQASYMRQQQQQPLTAPSINQVNAISIRSMPRIVPHIGVPTTSRGHTGNPPPYHLVNSRVQHLGRTEPLIRMLYEEFPQDFTIPISSANVMVNQRTMNH